MCGDELPRRRPRRALARSRRRVRGFGALFGEGLEGGFALATG